MIDGFSAQLTALLVESVLCFVLTPMYALSKDPLKVRKSVIVLLNLSCGLMLLCEYLFYIFKGSTTPLTIAVMHVVNAGVYYLIVLMLLFYAMLVYTRLFKRFDFKPDMPCRIRLIAVCLIVAAGLTLVTVSQFTGIYYSFDSNNVYQRGPFFWLAAVIPTLGAVIVESVIIENREKLTAAQRLVLVSYLLLPIIGEVIQICFFGSSMMNICMGLSVLLMFFENIVHKEKEIVLASKTEIRTGLANEHALIEWVNSKRDNNALKGYSAVFFDLRKFSDVNRAFGIMNGNRILANYSVILQDKIERDEILGRQFGNQFLAIMKDRNLSDFLRTLNGVEVPFTDSETGNENKVMLSARAGIYRFDRFDLSGEDVLVFAAQAFIEAKAKNSDDVIWLTQEMLDNATARKKLESEIKTGLRNNEFKPFYQPKVNSRTGKICGIEALARWVHDGKTIPPESFIPIMESNDTIRYLDMHILRCVCKDISKWLKEGIEIPVISINFSRRNLADHELAKKIDSEVMEANVPKDLIEIEVTETVDEFSIGDLNDFVDELHKLGYKVSIDDFGSASSSLTLLREIAFDTLKIDKGFIDNSKERDRAILTYIIKLAKEIDTNIVVEGVEQKSQVDALDSLGVNVIQGFFYDKPLSKDDITARLKSPFYS